MRLAKGKLGLLAHSMAAFTRRRGAAVTMDDAAALRSAAEGELGATASGMPAVLRCCAVEPRCVVLCAECMNDEYTLWIQRGISVGLRQYVSTHCGFSVESVWDSGSI